ncbi:basic proline-rich protein-like [Dryobates pubescens]|uniref:basic proline-rich protein-like n=1 Tax=Dryobates pubescens TaxID=118200 RepID=UPI0023B8D17B|nr:basic proline-rich protein-like [Dryobates pubescens]
MTEPHPLPQARTENRCRERTATGGWRDPAWKRLDGREREGRSPVGPGPPVFRGNGAFGRGCLEPGGVESSYRSPRGPRAREDVGLRREGGSALRCAVPLPAACFSPPPRARGRRATGPDRDPPCQNRDGGGGAESGISRPSAASCPRPPRRGPTHRKAALPSRPPRPGGACVRHPPRTPPAPAPLPRARRALSSRLPTRSHRNFRPPGRGRGSAAEVTQRPAPPAAAIFAAGPQPRHSRQRSALSWAHRGQAAALPAPPPRSSPPLNGRSQPAPAALTAAQPPPAAPSATRRLRPSLRDGGAVSRPQPQLRTSALALLAVREGKEQRPRPGAAGSPALPSQRQLLPPPVAPNTPLPAAATFLRARRGWRSALQGKDRHVPAD